MFFPAGVIVNSGLSGQVKVIFGHCLRAVYPVFCSQRRTQLGVMEATVQAEFRLFGTLKHEGEWYIAHCPPLDVTTQGRTEDEARHNLVEACELFVISCLERGTFDQALRELGWHVVNGDLTKSARPLTSVPHDAFSFSVPVPFGLEKTA